MATKAATKRKVHAMDAGMPSKKRKLNGKQFSDPSEREKDGGLTISTSTEGKGIDYTKYAPQTVDKIDVAGCVHKIAYPPGFDEAKKRKNRFSQTKSDKVIKFAYELDVFQKQSICGLEAGDNVLVSAHTSAGKTTVAEYAIARALAQNERVIYTSPIKALSNQKYRQLQERFLDVGLMTGDTSMNRDASCLVMTTEILRNMLYRGAEIIREISCVIFDEIHYMKDPKRGVVWEETLILLPQVARFVFLSATIPNSVEFAKWIAKINAHPCHVVCKGIHIES